ncbi:MAG: hypothetical protein FWE16_03195 [Firmicutes bacterium]|nr:hypothetical protein [Bacillota bacterium]
MQTQPRFTSNHGITRFRIYDDTVISGGRFWMILLIFGPFIAIGTLFIIFGSSFAGFGDWFMFFVGLGFIIYFLYAMVAWSVHKVTINREGIHGRFIFGRRIFMGWCDIQRVQLHIEPNGKQTLLLYRYQDTGIRPKFAIGAVPELLNFIQQFHPIHERLAEAQTEHATNPPYVIPRVVKRLRVTALVFFVLFLLVSFMTLTIDDLAEVSPSEMILHTADFESHGNFPWSFTVDEYDSRLFIPMLAYSRGFVDMDVFNNAEQGDLVAFWIRPGDAQRLVDGENIIVVMLVIEGELVFDIDDYNDAVWYTYRNTLIGMIVFASIFFIVALSLYIVASAKLKRSMRQYNETRLKL